MSDFIDMTGLAIIPSPAGNEGYVELSRTPTGRVFRKHLLTLGTLDYEGQKLKLDDSWYQKLKGNFESGVSIVQVPLADSRNRHSEDPLRNTGEVIDIQRDGDKVYSVIDVRDPDVAQRIADKRILGASALLSMDYRDTRTQEKVGPALLHHCLTNRPYVVGLDDYEEVVAASMVDMEDEDVPVVLAALEEPVPTKEEMLAALKAEHGIDVEALQETAVAKTDTAALTSAIVDALKGTGQVSLTADGTLEQSDVVGAIVELARKNETLESAVVSLTRKDAVREVQGYIDAGRVLPKQKDAFIKLALEDRDTLDTLLPDEPVVRLNHQQGVQPNDEGGDKFDVGAETTRLVTLAGELAGHANGAGKK